MICVSTDAEKFLLSGNHAKSFLKRQDSWDICDELFYKARPYDINAECCDKACDSEEFEETTDPYDDNDYLQNYVRTNLQFYLTALFLASYLKAVSIVALVVRVSRIFQLLYFDGLLLPLFISFSHGRN